MQPGFPDQSRTPHTLSTQGCLHQYSPDPGRSIAERKFCFIAVHDISADVAQPAWTLRHIGTTLSDFLIHNLRFQWIIFQSFIQLQTLLVTDFLPFINNSLTVTTWTATVRQLFIEGQWLVSTQIVILNNNSLWREPALLTCFSLAHSVTYNHFSPVHSDVRSSKPWHTFSARYALFPDDVKEQPWFDWSHQQATEIEW